MNGFCLDLCKALSKEQPNLSIHKGPIDQISFKTGIYYATKD